MDELEDQIDKVLAPDRAMRWMVRLIVLIVIVGAASIMLRVAWHMVGKVDQAVDEVEAEEVEAVRAREAREAQEAEQAALNHNWFILKKDAVDAAALEVRAAHEALARHQIEADSRIFSRESDRLESTRLSGAITTAQRNRINLIRDYNDKATRVAAAVLGDLPLHIEVVGVLTPQPEEE